MRRRKGRVGMKNAVRFSCSTGFQGRSRVQFVVRLGPRRPNVQVAGRNALMQSKDLTIIAYKATVEICARR